MQDRERCGGGEGRSVVSELWAVVWSCAVRWSLESGVSAVGEELERSERSGAKARGLPDRA